MKPRRRRHSEQRVKLADVAREAGVSSATVSRALHSPTLVSSAVRERIESSIAKLGYVPDGIARALAMQRSRTIGAIVPTIEGSIFARAIMAFQERLDQENYTLLLASTDYRLDQELPKVKAFVERGVDGIMLVGSTHSPEVYSLLKSHNIPYINTVLYNDGDHPTCGFDHSISTAQLVQYLVGLNHKNFGMITGFVQENDRVRARARAAIDAAAAHGIKIPQSRILESGYTIASACSVAEDLLRREPDITALICTNDLIAMGAIAACRHLERRVPDDISIVGHGEFDVASQLTPSLTTIRTPDRKIGEYAADFLLGKAEGREVEDHILLSCELCIRDSTGPAPG